MILLLVGWSKYQSTSLSDNIRKGPKTPGVEGGLSIIHKYLLPLPGRPAPLLHGPQACL